jgi:hypothetical protein
LLHLPLLLAACGGSELDGTWRHPSAAEVPPGGLAYELALGQYGPEVAGLVRTYQGLGAGGAADPYLVAASCTLVEGGSVRDGALRFRFHDASGAAYLASLQAGESELLGSFVAEDGLLRVVRFVRVSEEVDRDCGQAAEPFVVRGVLPAREEPPPALRVALAFAGRGGAGSFLAPWRVATPDRAAEGAPTFSFSVTTVPDSQLYAFATTDGTLRFAYALFLAFDDRDGDGRWDQGYFGADPEPLLGAARDRALAYLRGRGAAVFPDQPELASGLEQGYSLVTPERDAGSGRVARLAPTSPDDIVQVIVPAAAADLPLLEAAWGE